MSFVIYSEDHGIYLGSYMGLGFWSKLDPAGHDTAPTFPDLAAIRRAIAQRDNPRTFPAYTPISVEPDRPGGYASIAACVKAGLPSWEPNVVLSKPPTPVSRDRASRDTCGLTQTTVLESRR